MNIEHIRNPIDAQLGVMVEIAEKQGNQSLRNIIILDILKFHKNVLFYAWYRMIM